MDSNIALAAVEKYLQKNTLKNRVVAEMHTVQRRKPLLLLLLIVDTINFDNS